MTSQLNPIAQSIDNVNICHLPIVVKNHPKKCALPERRVESQWKVWSPSLELIASSCSKISRVNFQNPPIDFPLWKSWEHVPQRLFWTT